MIIIAIFLTGIGGGIVLGSKLNPFAKGEIKSLNHIAIRVADFEQSMAYYRDTLGFSEAFRFEDENGNPSFAYLQINASTFMEIIPATEENQPGFDHFGLETDQIETIVSDLKEKGLEASGPLVSSRTGTHIGFTKDPDGINIELIRPVDGSLHRKVMDAWKD